MNKKAQFYNVFLTFGAIGAMVFALMVLSPITWENNVGKRQIDIMHGYLELEKDMAYLDQAARLDSQASLHYLALNGGYYSVPSTCVSTSNGYVIWNTGNGSCYPDARSGFERIAAKGLPDYIEQNARLAEISYDVSIIGDNVAGIPDDMLFFPKKPPEELDDTKKAVSELGFDRYKISTSTQISCDDAWLDNNYDVVLEETYPTISRKRTLNIGNKFVHADVVYDGDSLMNKPDPRITIKDIGEEKGQYCSAYNPNPLYNIKLETLDKTEVQCSVQTGVGFEGNDLRTWNPDSGDASCKDSSTWLQCPGIKIYYCGKTSYDSFPKRYMEFPDWQAIKEGGKVEEYFVTVKEDDISSEPHIRSKTTFKFLVEIDKDISDKSLSLQRDSFTKKWVEDSIEYAKTRVVSSDVKGEQEYPFYYSVEPAFNVELDTQITDYDDLELYAKEISYSCNLLDLESCVRDILTPSGLRYKVTINGNAAEFDVYSEKPLMNKNLEIKPLNYRFALALS